MANKFYLAMDKIDTNQLPTNNTVIEEGFISNAFRFKQEQTYNNIQQGLMITVTKDDTTVDFPLYGFFHSKKFLDECGYQKPEELIGQPVSLCGIAADSDLGMLVCGIRPYGVHQEFAIDSSLSDDSRRIVKHQENKYKDRNARQKRVSGRSRLKR